MRQSIIKTEAEYQQALKRLDQLFDALENTPEGDEAELLMLLIENYEEKHIPMKDPDPLEAIKFRMEQRNMTRKDLAEILGYKSRVSEILSGKRKLSLKMIKALHERMNIPYESLIT